jgi:hypothetical protein
VKCFPMEKANRGLKLLMSNVSSVLAPEVNEQTKGRPPREWRIGVFFLLLVLVEWYLYFRDPGHFFQADGIFILYHRPQSWAEFLGRFTSLDISGWYRPLSHHAVGFLLFPFLDLEPAGYHIFVYMLFLANTVAVYVLAFSLMQRHVPAAVATFFFAVHTTNAFTTYDVGFLPELLYTLFYISAVIGYVRFVRKGSRTAYCLSVVSFVMSLLSKEAAITLPATLFLTHLFVSPALGSVPNRIRSALKPIAAYLAIGLVYAGYILGYLHVQNFDLTKIFRQPASVSEGSYQLVLDRTVPLNADTAFSWAFNMPRGWITSFRDIPDGMLTFLKAFRAVTIGLTLFLLLQGPRRILLFGLAWFCLTILPALPLVNHFLPYYLFLPLAGFSLVLGTVFAWVGDRLWRMNWAITAVTIALLVGGLTVVCNASIQRDVDAHPLLGGSARRARRSVEALKSLHPTLPANATVYFADDEEPLAWDHAWGGLIKMAYSREDVRVLYSSFGDLLTLSSAVTRSNTVVLRQRGENLIDETTEFFNDPSAFAPFKSSNSYAFTVSADRVVAGQGFSITIRGGTGVVSIAYTLDDGPIETFKAYLDLNGNTQFDVSADTRKGLYRFVGFSLEGRHEWIRADAAITVE